MTQYHRNSTSDATGLGNGERRRTRGAQIFARKYAIVYRPRVSRFSVTRNSSSITVLDACWCVRKANSVSRLTLYIHRSFWRKTPVRSKISREKGSLLREHSLSLSDFLWHDIDLSSIPQGRKQPRETKIKTKRRAPLNNNKNNRKKQCPSRDLYLSTVNFESFVARPHFTNPLLLSSRQ